MAGPGNGSSPGARGGWTGTDGKPITIQTVNTMQDMGEQPSLSEGLRYGVAGAHRHWQHSQVKEFRNARRSNYYGQPQAMQTAANIRGGDGSGPSPSHRYIGEAPSSFVADLPESFRPPYGRDQ